MPEGTHNPSAGGNDPFDYPVVLRLKDRPCLVVGGGNVALRKVSGLLRSGARVTVIAPEVHRELAQLASDGRIRLEQRVYRQGDVRGFTIVMGAVNDPAVCTRLSEDAAAAGIPVNLADRPEFCDFILPSCLRRGDLLVAVSTGGKSPALARHIRLRLERELGHEYALHLEALDRVRRLLKQRLPGDPARRRAVLMRIIDSDMLTWLERGHSDRFWRRVMEWLAEMDNGNKGGDD